MLQEALRLKSLEQGYKYTYRQLEADSDTSYSYVSKVIKGERQPSPEVLEAWSKALHPYFPLDVALVSVGLVPANPQKRAFVQEIAALPGSGFAALLKFWREGMEERRFEALEGDMADQDTRRERRGKHRDLDEEEGEPPPDESADA